MIAIEESRLESLLTEATKRGAELAFKRFVRYNYTEAAKLISITPKTLSKYILLGKIKAVDGMVSGEEIDRYLRGGK
jgi:hypothetical protein